MALPTKSIFGGSGQYDTRGKWKWMGFYNNGGIIGLNGLIGL